ncbi:uncharacterized protein B0H18DRAFT_951827 [Fomitopsis serialis]|uniref:uncharacterized protein n=1 Tax=Fomitopsis serialis TaxID=139415 RepID=UPI002008BAA1|nr:uncharacterized protein B0H18DRAFT_951827 [Neoantrodia serialis]KAH9933866.1 hypothetical protein B0H18DRAFT_951827 [Neoantrodia serialis]
MCTVGTNCHSGGITKNVHAHRIAGLNPAGNLQALQLAREGDQPLATTQYDYSLNPLVMQNMYTGGQDDFANMNNVVANFAPPFAPYEPQHAQAQPETGAGVQGDFGGGAQGDFGGDFGGGAQGDLGGGTPGGFFRANAQGKYGAGMQGLFGGGAQGPGQPEFAAGAQGAPFRADGQGELDAIMRGILGPDAQVQIGFADGAHGEPFGAGAQAHFGAGAQAHFRAGPQGVTAHPHKFVAGEQGTFGGAQGQVGTGPGVVSWHDYGTQSDQGSRHSSHSTGADWRRLTPAPAMYHPYMPPHGLRFESLPSQVRHGLNTVMSTTVHTRGDPQTCTNAMSEPMHAMKLSPLPESLKRKLRAAYIPTLKTMMEVLIIGGKAVFPNKGLMDDLVGTAMWKVAQGDCHTKKIPEDLRDTHVKYDPMQDTELRCKAHDMVLTFRSTFKSTAEHLFLFAHHANLLPTETSSLIEEDLGELMIDCADACSSRRAWTDHVVEANVESTPLLHIIDPANSTIVVGAFESQGLIPAILNATLFQRKECLGHTDSLLFRDGIPTQVMVLAACTVICCAEEFSKTGMHTSKKFSSNSYKRNTRKIAAYIHTLKTSDTEAGACFRRLNANIVHVGKMWVDGPQTQPGVPDNAETLGVSES